MKFSIQFKMLFLLVFIVSLFILGSFLLKTSEEEKIAILLKEDYLQNKLTLEKSVKILGREIHNVCYDYSFWDEMVQFSKKPDLNWAEINLVPAMDNFNSDVVWVYSKSLSPVYIINNSGSRELNTLPVDSVFFQKLPSNYFSHFFQRTNLGVVEIFGAPIQPSADFKRNTEPQGFLFIGRILSNNYFSELSDLLDSKITLSYKEPLVNIPLQNLDFTLISSSMLPDWKNNPSGYIVSEKKSSKFEKVYKLAHLQFLSFIAFSLFVIFTFSLLLYYIVNRPLKLIFKTLDSEDPVYVKAIENSRDEFGQIASHLKQFFLQKEVLAKEIFIRKNTEENLLLLQADLELKVEKRTLELSRVNKALEEDIIEREKIGYELRKLNSKFMKLFYMSPYSICIIRLDTGILQDVNHGFTNLTGFDAELILGKSFSSLNLFEDMEKFYNICHKAYNDEMIEEMESALLTKAGENKIVFVSVSTVEINEELTVICIMRDITEKKLMEEQLLIAKHKAENSDKMKSEFLAQMSHEIRSPLNSILSFTGLLKAEMEDKLSDELGVSFIAIDNAGARIIRTIDLLLNMSEVQTGLYDPIFRQLNLISDILDKAYMEFWQIARNKHLDFELLNLTDKNDFIVNADEYTIMQIFNNLINNAIKYTDKGYVKIIIECACESSIKVKIIDSGIGISEDYKVKLFNPFTQEEQGYTRKFEGNGLGLALVKKYCEINNFEIEVDSKKNHGSVFSIIMPLVTSEQNCINKNLRR